MTDRTPFSSYKGRSIDTSSSMTGHIEKRGNKTVSLSITGNATQLVALIGAPLLLLFLVYLSSKAIGGFSRSSRRKKREEEAEKELVQLLISSGLLDPDEHQSTSLNSSSYDGRHVRKEERRC